MGEGRVRVISPHLYAPPAHCILPHKGGGNDCEMSLATKQFQISDLRFKMKGNETNLDTRGLARLLPGGGRAHFIGLGGISMSGLAQALLARGWQVSGSDLAESDALAHLRQLGARVFLGHAADNVIGADLVIYSDAIAPDNPELLSARARGIPLVRRSSLLGQLAADLRTIAISGTHGKTTTTAMIAAILSHAGLSPTMFLGGEYPPLGGNACLGRGEWAVVEACEAFSSFLDLSPEIAVLTNIEPEHLDYHGSEEALRASFLEFLRRLNSEGTLVVYHDDPRLPALAQQAGVNKVIDYGLQTHAAFRATQVSFHGAGSEFVLLHPGPRPVHVKLQVPGQHNILNATAALAASSAAGVELGVAAEALANFSGVKRRFQIITRVKGITVVDDYAHHPTEMRAVFSAVRQNLLSSPEKRGRLVAVFQPHLYSRTQFFLREFAEVLSQADLAWVTDIYPAREAPIPGVNADKIAQTAKKEFGGNVEYLSFEEVVPAVLPQLIEGDIVLTLGAGNVDRIARSLAEALSAVSIPEHGVCIDPHSPEPGRTTPTPGSS